MAEDRSVLTRVAAAPDRTLNYGTSPEQVADVRYGDAASALKRPLVIMLHGGFWRPAYDRTHTGPMTSALARAGWTVASPEYRRVPGDPDAMLSDVAAAIATLPARIVEHNGRVVLAGHSAGGHLALWASVVRHSAALAGTLALAPVADLMLAYRRALDTDAVSAFLGGSPESRADIDPTRMPTPRGAVTIVHGEDDTVVPLAVSQSYVSKHPEARLVRVPDAGHFALIDPSSAAWKSIVEELDRLR
jgi:acetyl esterase/lipase